MDWRHHRPAKSVMNCKDKYSLWDNRKQACLELQDGSSRTSTILQTHKPSLQIKKIDGGVTNSHFVLVFCLSVWPVRHESIATTNICVHSWSHLRWVWGQSVSTVWFSSLGFPSWWFLPYWGPGTKPGPTRAADTWWTSRWRSSFQRPTPWTCTLVWTHPDTQTHRKHFKCNQQRDHFVVFLTRPPASHLCASTCLIARLDCFYLSFILKFKLGAFILKWTASSADQQPFSFCHHFTSIWICLPGVTGQETVTTCWYFTETRQDVIGHNTRSSQWAATNTKHLEGDRSHYTHTIASAALQRSVTCNRTWESYKSWVLILSLRFTLSTGTVHCCSL